MIGLNCETEHKEVCQSYHFYLGAYTVLARAISKLDGRADFDMEENLPEDYVNWLNKVMSGLEEQKFVGENHFLDSELNRLEERGERAEQI